MTDKQANRQAAKEAVAHTPGPWGHERTPESSHWDWKVTMPRKGTQHPYIGIDTDCAEADARLIAAAPDLLAACIAYIEDRREAGCVMDSMAVMKMRGAIAKATGAAT